MSSSSTIFFTGGTSGLGKSAVRTLVASGHHVYLAARNPDKAADLVSEAATLKGNLSIIPCDLNDLSSLNRACETLKENVDKLDLLVNNAGLWNSSYQESEDGIESTLQVNLIAPLFLSITLLPLLKLSENGKIINTASGLHQGDISFDDLQFKERFSGFKAYRQSKLGVILLTRLMAHEHPSIGIYTFHPGFVSTSLGRHLGGLGNILFKFFGISAEKGANTLIYLTAEPKDQLKSGAYYYKRAVKTTTENSYDLEKAKQLKQQLLDLMP